MRRPVPGRQLSLTKIHFHFLNRQAVQLTHCSPAFAETRGVAFSGQRYQTTGSSTRLATNGSRKHGSSPSTYLYRYPMCTPCDRQLRPKAAVAGGQLPAESCHWLMPTQVFLNSRSNFGNRHKAPRASFRDYFGRDQGKALRLVSPFSKRARDIGLSKNRATAFRRASGGVHLPVNGSLPML